MDTNEVRHLDACIYLTFREEERRHFPADVSATNQVRDMTIKRPFCWLPHVSGVGYEVSWCQNALVAAAGPTVL